MGLDDLNTMQKQAVRTEIFGIHTYRKNTKIQRT